MHTHHAVLRTGLYHDVIWTLTRPVRAGLETNPNKRVGRPNGRAYCAGDAMRVRGVSSPRNREEG